MQVNTKGVISLGSSFVFSTPSSLPLTGTYKVIAPYWADVDTRGTGNIYYRQTTDPSLLARATSEIRAAFPMSQNSTITNIFIATWDSVGYYYRNTDKVSVSSVYCMVLNRYLQYINALQFYQEFIYCKLLVLPCYCLKMTILTLIVMFVIKSSFIYYAAALEAARSFIFCAQCHSVYCTPF